jgi:hypothetical protein
VKVYHVTLSIAISDPYPEAELIERIVQGVAAIEGDASRDVPTQRVQAKATLTSGDFAAPDADDYFGWHRQACDAIHKSDPLDVFTDQRQR